MMPSMRIESLRWKLLLSCLVCILFGSAASGHAPNPRTLIAGIQTNSIRGSYIPQKSKFSCLPKDVQLDEVVTYSKGSRGNITVEKRLIEMKAQCRSHKLVDAKRRQIRFFRPSCWGNPPPDYLEVQQRENADLEKLKRTYTVIVFGCNRMISRLWWSGLIWSAPAERSGDGALDL
jgi:hypothetical protein